MTLVESIQKNKADFNSAVDAVVAQVNSTRAKANASFDEQIATTTAIAADFPNTLVTIAPMPDHPVPLT
jgi:hypothetical protein